MTKQKRYHKKLDHPNVTGTQIQPLEECYILHWTDKYGLQLRNLIMDISSA